MKSFNEIHEDLEEELRAILPDEFDDTHIYTVANWVLREYKPPIEWQEDPPDEESKDQLSQWAWTIKVRTLIAGQFLEYVGHETDESRVRNPAARNKHRDFMRDNLGRAVARFLDPEVEK